MTTIRVSRGKVLSRASVTKVIVTLGGRRRARRSEPHMAPHKDITSAIILVLEVDEVPSGIRRVTDKLANLSSRVKALRPSMLTVIMGKCAVGGRSPRPEVVHGGLGAELHFPRAHVVRIPFARQAVPKVAGSLHCVPPQTEITGRRMEHRPGHRGNGPNVSLRRILLGAVRHSRPPFDETSIKDRIEEGTDMHRGVVTEHARWQVSEGLVEVEQEVVKCGGHLSLPLHESHVGELRASHEEESEVVLPMYGRRACLAEAVKHDVHFITRAARRRFPRRLERKPSGLPKVAPIAHTVPGVKVLLGEADACRVPTSQDAVHHAH